MRSPELASLCKSDAIVLLPVGSIEQHGPHLPVETDSRLAEEVCVRAADLMSESYPVVVAPTVWCGMSEHHMGFVGTISVTFATFSGILRNVCETIQRHGFTKLMIVNGHGGNIAGLQVLVGELTRELKHPVKALTYCALKNCAEAYAGILEDQENLRHAGEAETSMMLVLTPDRIDRDAMLNASNSMHDFSSTDRPYRFVRFDEFTATGVNGITRRANEEKGEALLAAGAEAVADVLREEFMS
ncbi:MAG: creatininase family protein [Hyphomicrobiaceae bacterium]|nr:creatininase family protein [Hyphomicrobiaceae bacterium]